LSSSKGTPAIPSGRLPDDSSAGAVLVPPPSTPLHERGDIWGTQAVIPEDARIAAAVDTSSTIDRLRACQLGVARLYAQLRWLQGNPEKVDDVLESGRAISRHVRAIKKLVELELHQHRLRGQPEIDVRGKLAKRVISLLVQEIIGVTREMVPPGDARVIIDNFEAAIEANPEIPWP
jgi:hypothetical protein